MSVVVDGVQDKDKEDEGGDDVLVMTLRAKRRFFPSDLKMVYTKTG